MIAHRGRASLLIAAVLAFLCQTVIFQTHVHPRVGTVAALSGGIGGQVAVRRNQPTPDQPVDCPICQELAHTGAYLTPRQVDLVAPPTVEMLVGVMPTFASTLLSRSHAWLSRAPPLLLHA